MKTKSFFNAGTAVFLALALVFVCFFSLPLVSSAETGTLGSESPRIYCTYAQDGTAVDGNDLKAGTYDVSFVLSGVKSVSVVEITATYDADMVTVAAEPSYQISDEEELSFDSFGYVLGDGDIVFGYTSENKDCSPVGEDQVLATVAITFTADCDAADCITVNSDPNKTFLQVDHDDDYSDEYALVSVFPGYEGNLYLMSCDVTPVIVEKFSVTGQVRIATDLTGTQTSAGIVGITVKVLKDNAEIATAETDENGNYTLSDIPTGEYTVTFSGPTTIDRTATLVVSSDKAVDSVISVDSVGIVICDYNKDRAINATDNTLFLSVYNGVSESSPYYDLNADTTVNASDNTIFLTFYSNQIVYTEIVL